MIEPTPGPPRRDNAEHANARDAEARNMARTAAARVRLHLAESAIIGLARRLEYVAAASNVRIVVRGARSIADVQILRLEAAGIADACRTSIAPRLIAHEEHARPKRVDLTAAADAVVELLEYSESGARA